jgi:uncharacterized paraquat-inducible protein A
VKGKRKGVGGLPPEVAEYAYWSRFLVKRSWANYAKGEKFCGTCEYVFKPSWPFLRCPSCGSLLRVTTRTNKKYKQKVKWAPDRVVRD